MIGSIPDLSGMTSLNPFDGSDNNLSGPLPSLDRLTQLESFHVSDDAPGGFPPVVTYPRARISGAGPLCPNFLIANASSKGDAATRSSPWHEACSNDIIFRDGLDPPLPPSAATH